MGNSQSVKPDYNQTWSDYSNTKLELESTWGRRTSLKRAQMGQAGLTPDSVHWQNEISGLDTQRTDAFEELAGGDMAGILKAGYGTYTKSYETSIQNEIQKSSGLSGPAWQDYTSANPTWNMTASEKDTYNSRTRITPGANSAIPLTRDSFEVDSKPLTGMKLPLKRDAWEQSGPSIRYIKSRDDVTANMPDRYETWEEWAEGTLSPAAPEEATEDELKEEDIKGVRDEAGVGGSDRAANPWV